MASSDPIGTRSGRPRAKPAVRRAAVASGDATLAAERVGGEIAGKYRIERLLGSGGMGSVYEAVHQFTQRRVAVKLMHPTFARSKLAAERFLREARAPGSVGHPGIVEVLDGGRDDDGSLYLVLELLEGETLSEALESGAMSEPRLGAIVLELLDALGAAHDAGLVHRDIKPENVFLTPAGSEQPQVKLLDFGVASLSEPGKPGLTVAGSVLGTPLYMSPEQALGHAVDARSDLWSVGAVMYQALAGHPPFRGESMQALIVSISTQEHLPLGACKPALPVRLVAVVERALHKDPAQRWQSAAEMAEALQHALDHARRAQQTGAGPIAPPPAALAASAAAAPAPAGARSWGARGAVGLGALALALGAVVAWIAIGRARDPARARLAPLAPIAAEAEAASPRPAPAAASPAPAAAAPAPAASAGATRAAGVPAAGVAGAPRAAGVLPVPAAPNAQPAAAAPPAQPQAQPLGLAAVSEVLRAHQDELQRCYQEAVVASLDEPASAEAASLASVRIDAAVAVTPAGAVERVALQGAAPEQLQRCARAAIRAWRFPASNLPSDLHFPLLFQREVVQP